MVLAMIPEIKARIDRRRRGIVVDEAAQWEAIPMFRMIRRMGEGLGLFQDVR